MIDSNTKVGLRKTVVPTSAGSGEPVASISCRDCGASIGVKRILSHPRSCIECDPEFGDPQGKPLYAAPPALDQATIEALLDPVVVHLNMLRGGIAKPSWNNIQHLYPEEFAEYREATIEACAKVAEATELWYSASTIETIVRRIRALAAPETKTE